MNTMTKEEALQRLAAATPVKAGGTSEGAKKGWEHRLGGFGADTPQHSTGSGGKQNDEMAEAHTMMAVQALGEKDLDGGDKWKKSYHAHSASAHAFNTGSLSAHTDAAQLHRSAASAHKSDEGMGRHHLGQADAHNQVIQSGKFDLND